MKGQPAVLLYHAIVTAPVDADPVERDLMVAPEEFEWQMRDLAGRGYRSLTLDQYWAVLHGEAEAERALLLTFDDAYADVDHVVTPILRRLGFSAVMFAPYDHLGSRNTWDADHKNLARLSIASGDQLRIMASGPWEIASHGLRHVDLTSEEPDQCLAQLAASRERLSEVVGKPVRDLAYPYGMQNGHVRRATRAVGYRMAFTDRRTSLADRFALDRRPIRGTDSRAVFRLKTSGSAGLLYGIADLAPGWARSAARRLTVTATAGRS
ncbi:MAG TPA: polysaccharide deacetylase family protein [Candidatus Dormibacteraeota bacterium]|nr:polysaccharide deacetylase family protein [Candidatus Dormibacteraeota bacterium]